MRGCFHARNHRHSPRGFPKVARTPEASRRPADVSIFQKRDGSRQPFDPGARCWSCLIENAPVLDPPQIKRVARRRRVDAR